jgi:cation diffusion facilitator family transporter
MTSPSACAQHVRHDDRPMSDVALSRVQRSAQIRRVLMITLVANIAVVIAKLGAGLAAGLLSVIAEAAHSSVDAGNNVLALALSRVAAMAPDEEHPYGHAKFETLGAVAIVAFLSVTVYELVSSALRRLATGGGHPEVTPFVVATMIFSAAVNYAVSRYEHRRARELDSDILLADAAHTRSDVYASGAVLVGLALVAAGYPRADALLTLLVAAIIANAVWRILRRTIPILVDERAVSPQTIRDVAVQAQGVVDVLDVRSRGREGEIFAELTITVDRTLNVEDAHHIADDVERRLASAIRAREVMVHVEPANREPR